MSRIPDLAVAILLAGCATALSAAPPRQPNIVLMLADDQGWDGLSVAMAPDIAGSKSELFQTPRLEAFARQGMRFTDAYAPAPVCSPSRISIQCGRTPAALHWTKAAPPETGHRLVEPRDIRDIPAGRVTFAELLHEAGYTTAHSGKWHIGGGGPGAHGYDEHDGDIGNEQAYKFTDPNPVDIFGMAARAEEFIKKARDARKPFYVQLSWNALHAPENALEATKRKYAAADGAGRQVERAAITEDLDTGVGRVLDAIDRLGLTGTRGDTVKELVGRLEGYLAAVDARMPKTNPDFDPAAPPPPRKQGGRGGRGGQAAPGGGPGKGNAPGKSQRKGPE